MDLKREELAKEKDTTSIEAFEKQIQKMEEGLRGWSTTLEEYEDT